MNKSDKRELTLIIIQGSILFTGIIVVVFGNLMLGASIAIASVIVTFIK